MKNQRALDGMKLVSRGTARGIRGLPDPFKLRHTGKEPLIPQISAPKTGSRTLCCVVWKGEEGS